MKDVSERIAALPPEKQTALLQRLRQKVVPRPASDPWMVRYRQNPEAQWRLFCFSYAGGGASVFRTWHASLPPEGEVCAIQLPGHEQRLAEPAYRRLLPLVETLAGVLEPYLDRPFAFFGHSMGALVSFELARQLRRTQRRLPFCLFLAAYRAPQLPNPNVKIYHLPEEVFKVVLRADGIPDAILQNDELMRAMLPTLRADFELCDTYRYQEEPPLACPLVLFGGQDDVRVQKGDLEAWGIHTDASWSLSMLPGSHFFLHSAQDLLLSAISREPGVIAPRIKE